MFFGVIATIGVLIAGTTFLPGDRVDRLVDGVRSLHAGLLRDGELDRPGDQPGHLERAGVEGGELDLARLRAAPSALTAPWVPFWVRASTAARLLVRLQVRGHEAGGLRPACRRERSWAASTVTPG